MPHIKYLSVWRSVQNDIKKSQLPWNYCRARRFFSAPNIQPTDVTIPSRWLSDLKARVGKCLIFGLKPGQVDFAGTILKELARDWRELLVGGEGYLVGPGRAGLERHKVVWGEMVGT